MFTISPEILTGSHLHVFHLFSHHPILKWMILYPLISGSARESGVTHILCALARSDFKSILCYMGDGGLSAHVIASAKDLKYST